MAVLTRLLLLTFTLFGLVESVHHMVLSKLPRLNFSRQDNTSNMVPGLCNGLEQSASIPVDIFLIDNFSGKTCFVHPGLTGTNIIACLLLASYCTQSDLIADKIFLLRKLQKRVISLNG